MPDNTPPLPYPTVDPWMLTLDLDANPWQSHSVRQITKGDANILGARWGFYDRWTGVTTQTIWEEWVSTGPAAFFKNEVMIVIRTTRTSHKWRRSNKKRQEETIYPNMNLHVVTSFIRCISCLVLKSRKFAKCSFWTNNDIMQWNKYSPIIVHEMNEYISILALVFHNMDNLIFLYRFILWLVYQKPHPSTTPCNSKKCRVNNDDTSSLNDDTISQ
jgi:hypothetical protein